MNNIAASYFSDEFDLSTSKAGIVASLFGLMNIFARSMGGVWSGKLRGRLAGYPFPCAVPVSCWIGPDCSVGPVGNVLYCNVMYRRSGLYCTVLKCTVGPVQSSGPVLSCPVLSHPILSSPYPIISRLQGYIQDLLWCKNRGYVWIFGSMVCPDYYGIVWYGTRKCSVLSSKAWL